MASQQAWDGLEVISRGAHRLCARDPDDSGQCLKFELPLAERKPAGLRQSLHRRLALHVPALGDNRTELRADRGVQARLGNAIDGYFEVCHDIVDTPHGQALQCDLRTNAGRPAPSLYRCI